MMALPVAVFRLTTTGAIAGCATRARSPGVHAGRWR